MSMVGEMTRLLDAAAAASLTVEQASALSAADLTRRDAHDAGAFLEGDRAWVATYAAVLGGAS